MYKISNKPPILKVLQVKKIISFKEQIQLVQCNPLSLNYFTSVLNFKTITAQPNLHSVMQNLVQL